MQSIINNHNSTVLNEEISATRRTSEADLGLLQHHKALHLGCCSSPRSASEHVIVVFKANAC